MDFINHINDFLKFLNTNKDLTIYEKIKEEGQTQRSTLRLRIEKVQEAQFLDLHLWSNLNKNPRRKKRRCRSTQFLDIFMNAAKIKQAPDLFRKNMRTNS